VIEARLREAGACATQVQAVWLKEANTRPTDPFPLHAQRLRDDLRAVVQNLHAKFPNLKLCYLSSRIYGGYASTTLNPEPYAYESAFAVRWLIEEQIAGDPALNHDPNAGPVMAPWLAWGPYLWADGLVPRADGLTWACADFSTADGTHPATSGRAKVAQMLLDFFTTDPTAEPWFSAANVSVEPRPSKPALRITSLWPNPARGVLFAQIEVPRATRVKFDIVTVDGRVVRRLPGQPRTRAESASMGGRLSRRQAGERGLLPACPRQRPHSVGAWLRPRSLNLQESPLGPTFSNGLLRGSQTDQRPDAHLLHELVEEVVHSGSKVGPELAAAFEAQLCHRKWTTPSTRCAHMPATRLLIDRLLVPFDLGYGAGNTGALACAIPPNSWVPPSHAPDT